MSCLPEIFLRSNYLQNPSKIGGVFSVNLRSTSFTGKQTVSVGDMRMNKTSRSLDTQRYPQKEDSMRHSKTRSFYQPRKEEGIEEKGHSFSNLNGKTTQQGEVEAASNFNVIKRQAMQAVHLARRTLELTQNQANNTKSQIRALRQGLTAELDTFTQDFIDECTSLIKQFRTQRRETLSDNKTIVQQLLYLSQEIRTSSEISGELRVRFESVVGQFV